MGKKYKPVALKVKPIYSDLLEKFRIKRDIKGDPLADMPELKPILLEFTPTSQYTQEQIEQFTELHKDFLLEEELKLIHQLMMNQECTFAWDATERGRFRMDFFPPVEMPVIKHKSWVLKNIPILPGMYQPICELIHEKINVGIYELLNLCLRLQPYTIGIGQTAYIYRYGNLVYIYYIYMVIRLGYRVVTRVRVHHAFSSS